MDTVTTLGNQKAQNDFAGLSGPTANPGRTWEFPSQAFRRLAGLNPFKTTYFSLYDSLDSLGDKLIAWSGVFFAIAAGVPLPLIGLIFGKIINQFPPSEAVIDQRITQLIGVAIAYFGVTALYATAFGVTSEKVSVRLRERLLNCLLHLDQAYLDTHDLDVNSLISEKIDVIQAGTSEKVGIFIQSMSYFVAAFTVGFILDARLTGILLASAIPAISLAFFALSPLITKFSRATAAKNEEANGIVENALRAVRVVQAYDMIAAICKQHEICVSESSRLGVKKALFAALQTGSIFFIAYSANGLAFYLGSQQLDGGNAGTVYAVVFLIIDASFVVGQFAPFLEIFTRAAAARSDIQDLFDAQTDAISAGAKTRSELKPDMKGQDVHFQNVNFAYPARLAVKALDNLSLTLQAGKFTALVGTSGGGKSTTVSLLLGTYDYQGSIMIGEHELRTIDGLHRRSQFGVLEQDCILFSGTVYDNICYGLIGQDMSEEEKRARCDEAVKDAAVDFLDLLPDGLNTHLSNEIQLSGGQRQRICLARALIKKPALLILDEPTSALDARSEVLVMESVKKATAAGTTVIMVAHRLSTTLDADHIIVMGEGRVLEEGTPEELSQSPSIFSKLLKTQNTNFMSRSNSLESTETLFNKNEDEVAKELSDNLKKVASLPDSDVEKPEDEVIKQMGLWTVTKRIGAMIKPQFWIVFIGVCGSIAAGGILLGESVIFGSLVELLNETSTSVDRNRTNLYCLLFFILGCVAFLAYISSGSAFGVTSTKLTSSIRVRTLHRLLHLDIAWFSQQQHSVHDLMAAFTKDPGDLSCLSGIALGTIFTVITSVFGGIILAHVVAWKIAIVLLAAVPVMIIAGFLRLRTLTLSEIRHREAYKGANTLAAEACRSRKTVAALGMEARLLQDYRAALNKPLKEIRRFTIVSSFLLAFYLAISYFVYALAYWWGSKQVRDGNYTTRDFFTVLPALLFSAQAAGQLFSLSPEIARAKTAARSIFSLLEAKSTILDMEDSSDEKSAVASSASTLHDIPPTTDKTKPPPKLSFDAVTLTYPGASNPALKSITLTIPTGQSVAFVGPSGGGKSSTIALIERFFDPSSGAVLLDGTDLRALPVRALRRTMALVSQEPDLFPGSIAHNIALGAASSPTPAAIEAVCRKCGIHDFIASLPEGYNTPCGSGSTSKLSGGQKQRLAIARALIRDPEILLLDEPTSALDAHSEAHVQAALTEAARGRTTIIVAHRLASVVRCDRIYVFDRGRVIAGGSHAQLLVKCGLYAGMAKAQSLA